jgi:TRAP-type C4-dicarboxylate transport system permease small subunit
MTSLLKTSADRLIDLSTIIGCLALFGEVAVILVDVVGRYFGMPLRGARDISQMGMVLVVFGGMALCSRQGAHIVVDLFEASFPDWLRRLTDVAGALIGAVIFVLIAYTVYETAKISQLLNLRTNILGWPRAYFQWAICAFALISSLALILRAIARATEREPETEPDVPAL